VRGGVGWGAGEFGGGGVSHHYDWKYCNVSEMLGVVMSNVYKFDYDSESVSFALVQEANA
jgi:hypothetical protein